MVSRSLKDSLLIGLFLLVAAAATAQDWAGKGRAVGVVRDEDRKPIEGAKVTIYLNSPENPPEAVYTDKRGRFSFGGLIGGVWTVLIDAEGYKPSEGRLSVSQFQTAQPAQITLLRDPQASITLGDSLLDSGQYGEAREEYMKAMEGLDEVGQARLHSRIGDTYLTQGNNSAARAEYEKALPYLEPQEQAHVRIQLGNAYQKEANYSAARAEYQHAVPVLAPEGQAVVLLSMAKGYDLEGNRPAALETLERALEVSPGNVQVIQVLADLLTREGREEEAQTYLAQLPEDVTLPTDLVLNIGIRLYNEGKTEKALGYFDRAVREAPDQPESYYYRGLSRLSQGKNEQAASDFKKLLELDPESPHAGEVKEFLQSLKSEG